MNSTWWDNVCYWIAYRLPTRVVYWAHIRRVNEVEAKGKARRARLLNLWNTEPTP
jgi:hypothetical protein